MQPPSELEIARTLPPAGCSLAQAERYTRWLATHHYENFHIASWLLPRRLHRHFYNVYAFCRWADDLGDEVSSAPRALELLDWWERELDLCYEGRPSHPVFIALAPTIRAFDIPADPFRHLLIAFRQDQTVHRYQSWDDLLGYCRYSANPVGRLVLYLCGYCDTARQQLSDATCTALQLANFWQDVSRDLNKGRIYIPLDALGRHGLDAADIEARRFDARYVALMKDLIARTREMFAAGADLTSRVEPFLRVDLELFSQGGVAVLDAIEAMGYNTLAHRPSIGPGRRARLLAHAVAGRIRAAFAPGAEPIAASPSAERPTLDGAPAVQGAPGELAKRAAMPQNRATAGAFQDAGVVAASYAECRRIARSAASNFYYAFYMLPRRKRDALCALYAFMRLVDDVSDTPSRRVGAHTEGLSSELSAASPVSPAELSAGADVAAPLRHGIAEKRAALASWRALLDRAVAGDTAAHPILPAFADVIRRYRIPPRYFHDLISGAEMDLTETRYPTFERLYEYCYRVAGTVGLTCLHVFGFSDPHAPELAERLGVAFQLTNIIRDVGDDLALGRVYLPSEDLTRFGCSVFDLARGAGNPAVRGLLHAEAERAWMFYAEGARLIRHIDRDSRAALWALARIYSTLLARIEDRDFDVFSSRVRLTVTEKTRILVRARLGWWSEGDVIEERDRDRRGTGGALLGRRAG
jgi:squalene synthase HpnC